MQTLDDLPGKPEAGAQVLNEQYSRLLRLADRYNVPLEPQPKPSPEVLLSVFATQPLQVGRERVRSLVEFVRGLEFQLQHLLFGFIWTLLVWLNKRRLAPACPIGLGFSWYGGKYNGWISPFSAKKITKIFAQASTALFTDILKVPHDKQATSTTN